MSLQEVLRSESIIMLKSLLKRNIDISSLCSTNDSISSIKEFAHELLINDSDHLQLNGDCQQVAVYISGYISLSLAERLKCPDCLCFMQNDQVSSEYFNNVNQGGLTLPNTALHQYVPSAFCLLEISEGQIRAEELLNLTTKKRGTSFACLEDSIKSKEIVNNILSKIYFNNLQKQISETYRKDKVSAFRPVLMVILFQLHTKSI